MVPRYRVMPAAAWSTTMSQHILDRVAYSVMADIFTAYIVVAFSVAAYVFMAL